MAYSVDDLAGFLLSGEYSKIPGWTAGNSRSFERKQREAREYDAFGASSVGTFNIDTGEIVSFDSPNPANVSPADVSQIGGTRTWPPADSSMISRADWAH